MVGILTFPTSYKNEKRQREREREREREIRFDYTFGTQIKNNLKQ